MDFYALDDTLDALEARLKDYFGPGVPVSEFEGDVLDAIRALAADWGDASEAVVFGFVEEQALQTSGLGKAYRKEYAVDFFAVVRSSGRDGVREDRRRLNALARRMNEEALGLYDQSGNPQGFRWQEAGLDVIRDGLVRALTGETDWRGRQIRKFMQPRRLAG